MSGNALTAAAAGAVDEGPPPGRDGASALDALRARGASRMDPVHFRYLETLARRAAAHQGEVKRILDARLAQHLGAFSQRLDLAPPAVGPAPQRPAMPALGALDSAPRHGPLADLVARIDSLSQPPLAVRPHATVGGDGADRGELKAMRYFRSTWSRLRVDRQLQLALAKVPENAGPLHTERLVLRTLQTLRDISPVYLDHFMSQIDTLLWLDEAQLALVPPPGKVARGDGDPKRKSGRGKAGA